MSTWDKASITAFCKSKTGEVALDRLVISRREGPRSWPQHATITIEQRPESEWIGELLDHLADLESSAHDSGAKSVEVELRVYRGTLPAGSRRYRVDLPQIVGAGLESEDDQTPLQSLTSALNISMRATVELAAEARRAYQTGIEVAGRALESSARLQMQIVEAHRSASEATAALAIAESQQSNGTADLMKLAEGIMPIVIAKMSMPSSS